MHIKMMNENDIENCTELLLKVYNCPPWNNKWTLDTATRYLKEFMCSSRFVGIVLHDDQGIVGSLFAHARTWYTGDELYIDEVFIDPDKQGRGFGKMLLEYSFEYVKENNIDGISLLTENDKPAYDFYKKQGFSTSEDLVFMYK